MFMLCLYWICTMVAEWPRKGYDRLCAMWIWHAQHTTATCTHSFMEIQWPCGLGSEYQYPIFSTFISLFKSTILNVFFFGGGVILQDPLWIQLVLALFNNALQCFTLLCLAKDHWWGFNIRSADMVHIVNSIWFWNLVSKSVEISY